MEGFRVPRAASRDSFAALVSAQAARFRRPDRTDVAFAAVVWVLFAASPLTGRARPAVSLALGGVAAAVTLGLRMRRPRPARGATLARPSFVIGLLAVVALAAFAPTLIWLYREYVHSVWQNAHGFFVPLFVVLLARSTLRRSAGSAEEASAWGFAFLVPALSLLVLDAGMRSQMLSALALVLVLPGLSLLLLGARRTRLLAVPLALSAFLIPIPTWVEKSIDLSWLSAELARLLLAPFDLPLTWHRTVVHTPQSRISISANCSAFSALAAGVAFGCLLACTARSRWRALLPFLVLYPIVVVTNGFRLAALVLLCLYRGAEIIHTSIHGLSGIAGVVIVLLGMWLCADRRGLREAIS